MGTKNAEVSDIIFVQKVLSGDTDAFAFVVKKYQNRIFNLLYQMTGNYHTAEDMAQDTFLKAFSNLRKYKIEYSFYNWLYTIALNIARNHLKRQKILRFIRFDLDAGGSLPLISKEKTGAVAETEQTNDIMRKAINDLPGKYSELIILRFSEGLSYKEIANILNMPLGTVETRIFRAKKRLKKILKLKYNLDESCINK